jgi:hypothetical protein
MVIRPLEHCRSMGHAASRDRTTGAQRDLPRKIARLRALLQRRAPQHVVHLAGLDARAFHRRGE